MTTEQIVTGEARVTRGRVLMNIAEGIETEDMPSPIEVIFYEAGSPGWDLRDTLSIGFADSRDLWIWVARLGWQSFGEPSVSKDGKTLIHTAYGDFHGWRVSAKAYDPAVTE